VLGLFEVQRLLFPPFHRLGELDPDRGYLVIVLEGAFSKRFPDSAASFSRDSFATMPAGARHTTEFGRVVTQVIVMRASSAEAEPLIEPLIQGRRLVKAPSVSAIGWRLAGELRETDASWPLAAEGHVLQLLAAAKREEERPRGPTRNGWLSDVRDLLHARTPRHLSLSELATAADVHPVHLARTFRREYGVTVAEYARNLRLEWAARQLAGEGPLAQIAAEAGFADQSHFTRAFRRYAGVTPGRYRRLVRA
jgi:AraC family transcriptional regulator